VTPSEPDRREHRGTRLARYLAWGSGPRPGRSGPSLRDAPFGDAVLPHVEDFEHRQTQWAQGWRRAVFPGIFLFYLASTASGVHDHTDGAATVVGYVILGLFATCYVRALPDTFGGPHGLFWAMYAGMWVTFLAEIPFAHQAAFTMITYLVVLTIATLGRGGLWIVGLLMLGALFIPPAVPSWHAGIDTDAAFSTLLVAAAMYGFFEIIRSNRALSEARSEVARLATETERSRIARDLHDLLGHSLTTITVKAGLAKRLAAVSPERAEAEIGEVEVLARRSLADVRAAVASYREVSLTGELASGREVLRAAGIEADFPGSTDVVRADLHVLFGWVVREGLTNVVRHSRARRCSIHLGPTWIEVVDDGIGLSGGLSGGGLRTVRERVAAAAGTVDVGPVDRAGWRLRVEVPELRVDELADDHVAGEAFEAQP
jgi:two-component system sensor histidine kinase DesK